MVGRERHRFAEVRQPGRFVLPGQRKHEVNIYTRETRRAHAVVGAKHLLARVLPAKGVE